MWWQQQRSSSNVKTAGEEPDTKVRRNENLRRGKHERERGHRKMIETGRLAGC